MRWYYAREAECLGDFTELAQEVLLLSEDLNDSIDSGDAKRFADAAEDMIQIGHALMESRASEAIESLSLMEEVASVASGVPEWRGIYATSVHDLLLLVANRASEKIMDLVIFARRKSGEKDAFEELHFGPNSDVPSSRVYLPELLVFGGPIAGEHLARYFDAIQDDLRGLFGFGPEESNRLSAMLWQEHMRVKMQRVSVHASPRDNSGHNALAVEHGPLKPRWDRARGELWVGKSIVKTFRQRAPNQRCVLNAFEEEGWPPRIDDPLSHKRDTDPRERLSETVRGLNYNSMVLFEMDGTGTGVLWKITRRSRVAPASDT